MGKGVDALFHTHPRDNGFQHRIPSFSDLLVAFLRLPSAGVRFGGLVCEGGVWLFGLQDAFWQKVHALTLEEALTRVSVKLKAGLILIRDCFKSDDIASARDVFALLSSSGFVVRKVFSAGSAEYLCHVDQFFEGFSHTAYSFEMGKSKPKTPTEHSKKIVKGMPSFRRRRAGSASPGANSCRFLDLQAEASSQGSSSDEAGSCLVFLGRFLLTGAG